MPQTYVEELRRLQALVEAAAATGNVPQVIDALYRTETAARQVELAWSGSNLGFHSRVYYNSFQTPPPGAHFSREWGFLGRFQGTTGDWLEMPFADVVEEIRDRSGIADLDGVVGHLAEGARAVFEDAQAEVVSVLSAFLGFTDADYIRDLKKQVSALVAPQEAALRRRFAATFGPLMSRDTVAIGQGIQPAPHEVVLMQVAAHRQAFVACDDLRRITKRAADHIERLTGAGRTTGRNRQRGTRVFIGHGRSPLWRELKDFVSDRLNLPYDEFNRVPVAGVTNIDRLSEMLDNAAVALLVLTAEDERADGAIVARQNVVHESGLFQGRLGFARAIILLEDGCVEFSNVNGLGQIRFPQGNISAKFEEVRQVLEREGLLT